MHPEVAKALSTAILILLPAIVLFGLVGLHALHRALQPPKIPRQPPPRELKP